MTIRIAKKDDIPAIVQIHKQCVGLVNALVYPPYVINEWTTQITHNAVAEQFLNSKWIVIEEKCHIVGFAQYSLDSCELYQIQVLPSYEGLGYGKKLYLFFENDCRYRGCKLLRLNATLNAIGFYKKMGFHESGHVSFPLTTTSCKMVRMTKKLS